MSLMERWSRAGETDVRRLGYLQRTLLYHARGHLAVALGVMVGTATLTGALLVGDSMRASLRETALARLGTVDHALRSSRFLRVETADELVRAAAASGTKLDTCPVIMVKGGAVQAETRARAGKVTVIGIDERFWRVAASGGTSTPPVPTGRSVLLNQRLAEQLGAAVGDDVLLRLGRAAAVSPETLLGRRTDTALTLRLTVRGIVAPEAGGSFALRQGQAAPANAWVALDTLQHSLDQPGCINALLATCERGPEDQPRISPADLDRWLHAGLTLADAGLQLRIDEPRGYLALEAQSVLLDPTIERAALEAAGAAELPAAPVLTYLANAVELVVRDGNELDAGARASVPYSTVSALGTQAQEAQPFTLLDGTTAPQLQAGDILLNEWAARDLAARVGDRIALEYYVTGRYGQLDTERGEFVLRGVVRLDERTADAGFTPPYRGVTDAKNLSDWDPPFPVDLARVTERDEEYWDRYQAAPKAFVSLADGRRLWVERDARFGRSTSIRVYPPAGADLVEVGQTFTRNLKQRLHPAQLGFAFEPVRAQALAASTGTTDFGTLFISFSFFLIAAAALLVALLFRLGAERRAPEVGLLLATGFTPATVTRLLLAEGTVVATVGALLGLLAALLYAWLMLAGLKSWWSGAVNAPFLRLHVSLTTFVIGFSASLAIALVSIAWSVRRLTHLPAHGLLAGATSADRYVPPRRSRRALLVCVTGFAAALLLALLPTFSDILPETASFFGGGAALVVACLGLLHLWLRAPQRTQLRVAGRRSLLKLGVRNAARHPGRSLLAASLIASATFVIAAIGAFRVDADSEPGSLHSPAGGFTWLGESAVPLPYDLNSVAGREALGVAEALSARLEDVRVMPFRLRPGDEASCRGLYRPTTPRILGAPDEMIERGGFSFAASIALTDAERRNPWLLLRRSFADGAIPALGAANPVKWQLHLDLGRDLEVTDERGKTRRLRFVALFDGGVLQDELVVAESQFTRLFPSRAGYAFFLLGVPQSAAPDLGPALERELDAYAFDASLTAQRLEDYAAVQNTYLATFRTLGGLGLVLGTLGLAVVLLRNVLERRGELALLRALGFSSVALGWIVLAENLLLVIVGLGAGAIPALLAIGPHIMQRPAQVPWLSIGGTLLAVLGLGVAAGTWALRSALRVPLLPALRRE